MKAVKELIITELKKKGVDFKKDYYELKHSQSTASKLSINALITAKVTHIISICH